MKKFYLAAIALLLSFSAIQAQTFEKGDKILNLGIGLRTGGFEGLSIPPITVAFEYAIVDNLFDKNSGIGIGAYADLSKYKHLDMFINLGAKGSFHYQFVNKLDTYTGLSVGFGLNGVGIGIGGHLGARYYFKEKFAAYAEIGHVGHVSALQIGVTFKL